MMLIRPATVNDAGILAQLGAQSFVQSHGHSAAEADITTYVLNTYTSAKFADELNNPANIFHIIYYKNQVAGYSKMQHKVKHPNLQPAPLSKLERLYLLKDFYGLSLGRHLFEHNLQVSKAAEQAGMWLFVWKGNERAVRFYSRLGFKAVGSHDFKISETHSNPNHQMLLLY